MQGAQNTFGQDSILNLLASSRWTAIIRKALGEKMAKDFYWKGKISFWRNKFSFASSFS